MDSFFKYIMGFGVILIAFILLIGLATSSRDDSSTSSTYQAPTMGALDTSPVQQAARQGGRVQESVLSYQGYDFTAPGATLCFLNDEHIVHMREQIAEGQDLSVAARARSGDGIIEIYVSGNREAFIVRRENDALGRQESCIIGRGAEWAITP